MSKRNCLPFVLMMMLLCVPTFGEENPVIVENPGFESVNSQGFPLGWSSEVDSAGAAVRIVLDRTQSHSGQNALLIAHAQWKRSTVCSEPVPLKVGRLYRLSGWVKTESAFSCPTDRYPTSVAGCFTMESFPFTNHSPTAGATSSWKKIETRFIATQSQDRIRLHLGLNGEAKGKIWFDDIQLEEVSDISSYIPMETVKWFGPAFRYEDRGWIFVHIEGKPYSRGYQYGFLVAGEIVEYMKKLAITADKNDPNKGWNETRVMADALMFRKYDEEYLTEMKGIADGAVKSGAEFEGRPLDLLDIVTLNSVIDLGQVRRGLSSTAHPLSGKSFLAAEDELNIPERLHKCSGFLANGPASKDGKIVFGQIFMWSGYTGPHWNVICDAIPSEGHRLVYETFPGGIHSAADFYINSAGIMIGETTVAQTPFDMDGTPQSNRIRKAAQYASSIDEVVKILSYKNNGMYTNDWLIGDTKTNEIAIFLLGTKKSKLWRSRSGEFPGGTEGFYWSDNNNKDPEVRKEYIPNDANAPYDLIYRTSNRDIQFSQFYKKYKGKIDAIAGVRLWASSPMNRPHACDGKITTSEMAEKMVFLIHSGKVTLREKFVGENGRIPDLPGAVPRLSLGYSVISPLFVTEKLQTLRKEQYEEPSFQENPKMELTGVDDIYQFNKRLLWHNTVYPASNGENWFISGTAAYWNTLDNLPSKSEKAALYLRDELTELNCRLLYTLSRDGKITPLDAEQVYDRYNHYQIPRIRGMFLLHQMRLLLGNDTFSKIMNRVHDRFREKEMTTKQFIGIAEKISGEVLSSFIMQWLNRDDLPEWVIEAHVDSTPAGWTLTLDVEQKGKPYHFLTTVAVETEKQNHWRKVEVQKSKESFTWTFEEKPLKLVFNAGSDVPVPRDRFYTLSNFYDDFHSTVIVYGTSRQIEANHTLALRYATVLADQYSEILPPVKKDSEITESDLASSDLFVLGGIEDNQLMKIMKEKLGLSLEKSWFRWQDRIYADSDDGLFVVVPNPFNSNKVAYLVIGNSALELYQMTKQYKGLPAWAIFKKDAIECKGYHDVENGIVRLQ